MKRLLSLLTAAALIATACNGDDAPNGPDSLDRECGVLADYIVSDFSFDGAGLDDATIREILETTSGVDAPAWPGVDSTEYNGQLRFWKTGATNVFDLVADLQTNGDLVAPIHLVAPMGHWSWAPGEEHESRARPGGFPDQSPPPTRSVVAVIDTGYQDPQVPWISSHVDPKSDPESFAMSGDPSHGTFIASVLRFVAPQSAVRLFKPEVELEAHIVREAGSPQVNLTSEIQLLSQIEVAAGQVGDQVKALNLSVGTYPCHMPEAPAGMAGFTPVPTMRAAIDKWQAATGTPVVAAAGNEDLTEEFYPAALDTVLGVAAIGPTTTQDKVITWQGGATGPPIEAERDPQAWATFVAPGGDLVGFGGPDQFISWSGSSFATAVVSGLIAEGKIDIDAIDPAVATVIEYGMVPGLAFWDQEVLVVGQNGDINPVQ